MKDDEGNPFTVYYFRDEAWNFDPNDYELAGETKRVSFQTVTFPDWGRVRTTISR